MMATCGRCGYDGPFTHGCGPSPAGVSLVPRVHDLEAEQQLRDQVAVVGRGVRMWHYIEMMLLPRMEGLVESLQASYEHTAKLEALAERRKTALGGVVKLLDNISLRTDDGWAGMGELKHYMKLLANINDQAREGAILARAAIEEEEK